MSGLEVVWPNPLILDLVILGVQAGILASALVTLVALRRHLRSHRAFREHLEAHRYVTVQLPESVGNRGKKFTWRVPKVPQPWQPQATRATSPAPGPRPEPGNPTYELYLAAHDRGEHSMGRGPEPNCAICNPFP